MSLKEIVPLTSLRGIAAVFIVFHHFSIYLLPEINQSISPYSPFIRKSYIWVDFFFILSGFILAYVYQQDFSNKFSLTGYKTYLWSRFYRIYPLHIFMLGIFFAMESAEYLHYLLADSHHQLLPFSGSESLPTLALNLVLLQALADGTYWNQPAWSISAEWLTYLLIPFALPWISRASALNLRIFLLFLTAALWFISLEKSSLDLVSVVRCILEASAGIVLFKLSQESSIIRLAKLVSAPLILLLVIISIALPVEHIITLILFYWLILSSNQGEELNLLCHPLVRYLGKISYSIYMTHWFVQVFLQKFCKLFWERDFVQMTSDIPLFVTLALSVTLVILVSHCSYHWVESPARNWFKQRQLKKLSLVK